MNQRGRQAAASAHARRDFDYNVTPFAATPIAFDLNRPGPIGMTAHSHAVMWIALPRFVGQASEDEMAAWLRQTAFRVDRLNA
jgi:hypothetical protein